LGLSDLISAPAFEQMASSISRSCGLSLLQCETPHLLTLQLAVTKLAVRDLE